MTRGGETSGGRGWDDGVSAGHGMWIKKRRARSVDGVAAREARRNARRAAGLDAAAARLTGVGPESPEEGRWLSGKG